MPDMTIDQVVDKMIATEVRDGKIGAHITSTEEFKGAVATAVNARIAEVETKLRSDYDWKLTAAEKEVAKLSERLQRREQFDRSGDFHRGIDGKIHPNVSKETSACLRTLVLGLKNKDHGAVRAISSTTDADGGVTLQENVAAEIVRLIPEYGTYPKIARTVPVTTLKTHIGSILTNMSARWPDENVAVTDSYPGFDKVTLEAKRVAAFIPIPLSYLEDSQVDFGQLASDLIRECVGKEIDRVAFVGKTAANGGTDPFDGLLYASGIVRYVLDSGLTHISDLDEDTGLSMIDKIPEGADEDNIFLFHKTVFNASRRLKDSKGQPIWQRPGDGEPGAIWNCDYTKTYRMPAYSTASAPSTRFMALGNWKKYALFGLRNELSIATSDVAGDAFEKFQLYVRGTTRVAIAAFGPAYVVAETAAS